MDHYSIVGILLALVGVLKGKDIWEYFKSRNELRAAGNHKVISIYENQIEELKRRVEALEKRIEVLTTKLQAKITKSRGKKRPEPES
jgi:cell division protein FtsB